MEFRIKKIVNTNTRTDTNAYDSTHANVLFDLIYLMHICKLSILLEVSYHCSFSIIFVLMFFCKMKRRKKFSFIHSVFFLFLLRSSFIIPTLIGMNYEIIYFSSYVCITVQVIRRVYTISYHKLQ